MVDKYLVKKYLHYNALLFGSLQCLHTCT